MFVLNVFEQHTFNIFAMIPIFIIANFFFKHFAKVSPVQSSRQITCSNIRHEVFDPQSDKVIRCALHAFKVKEVSD